MSNNVSRRDFCGVATASIAALMLAACGGSNAQNGEQKTDQASSGASATSPDGSYKLVNEGKLTCIANMLFPPFESMDEKTGEPVGFDIDMSKELAKRLGLEVSWLPSQAFDSLIPAIKAGGTADVAISGITITDARRQEVDLSDPYIDSNQSLLTKVGSTETLESLDAADKKIAVQAGTTGADWVAENLPKATRVPLDDIISAMNGVVTGNYEALVTDLPVGAYQIKKSFSDLQIIEEIPTGEQYGIAASKDNPGLTAAINKALAEMKKDGTLAKIETEWFGSEL